MVLLGRRKDWLGSLALVWGFCFGWFGQRMVGAGRFELPTSWSRSTRAARLRYAPIGYGGGKIALKEKRLQRRFFWEKMVLVGLVGVDGCGWEEGLTCVAWWKNDLAVGGND